MTPAAWLGLAALLLVGWVLTACWELRQQARLAEVEAAGREAAVTVAQDVNEKNLTQWRAPK